MKMFANQRGMTMIAILLGVLIISLMCYFAMKSIPKSLGNSNNNFVLEAGVDTSSYGGILESTKAIIKNAEATREYSQ